MCEVSSKPFCLGASPATVKEDSGRPGLGSYIDKGTTDEAIIDGGLCPQAASKGRLCLAWAKGAGLRELPRAVWKELAWSMPTASMS